MTNPYQAPTTAGHSEADQRRVWIALVPFFAAPAILMAAAIGLWFSRPFGRDPPVVLIGVLAAFIFDLTVCAYVLVQWLMAGRPSDLLAELLMTTPEERELHRKLRARPQLDEEAFYDAFYKGTDAPKHVVILLRRILERAYGVDLSGLHPGDNLAYVDVEMDAAFIFDRIDRDFKANIPRGTFQATVCTFDSLLRAVLQYSVPSASETSARGG